jgi:hypothetical protein
MNEHSLKVALASVISFFLGAGIVSLMDSNTTMCSTPAPREVSQQIAYLSDVDVLSSKVASCGSTIDIDNIHTANQIRDALTNLISDLRSLQ